jgi:hypothetical protein
VRTVDADVVLWHSNKCLNQVDTHHVYIGCHPGARCDQITEQDNKKHYAAPGACAICQNTLTASCMAGGVMTGSPSCVVVKGLVKFDHELVRFKMLGKDLHDVLKSWVDKSADVDSLQHKSLLGSYSYEESINQPFIRTQALKVWSCKQDFRNKENCRA